MPSITKECIGDDLKPKWGALFPRMTGLKRGETVVFSYSVFKSRAHLNRVNARVMKEIVNTIQERINNSSLFSFAMERSIAA